MGFALQLIRTEERGVGFLGLYGRRLFVLLLIGWVHEIFVVALWRLDILHQYAIVGFLLLPFRRWQPRNLLIAGSLCVLINPARAVIEGTIHDDRLADQQTAQLVVEEDAQREAEGLASGEEARRLQTEGSYWARAAFMAEMFFEHPDTGYYLEFIPRILALFLLGLFVGRLRIFENLSTHLRLMRKVMWWGLGAGLAGNLALVFTRGPDVLFDAPRMMIAAVAHPALSFSYAAAVLLLTLRPGRGMRLTPLAAVGRMALTNYLLQGLILAVVCSPNHGLGLYRGLSVVAAWTLALAAFGVQALFSIWWLRHFRFGPVEWLWRSATYWEWQPMRLQVPA